MQRNRGAESVEVGMAMATRVMILGEIARRGCSPMRKWCDMGKVVNKSSASSTRPLLTIIGPEEEEQAP